MRGQRIFCFGFGPWKFGFVRSYLRPAEGGGRAQIAFCTRAWQARLRGFDASCKILVWGLREKDDVKELSARYGVPIWRMEDGFLRSVGLGSDFHTPASLVLDRRGIYFDPTRPSDLEAILETADFSEAELRRAASLREDIVRSALTKYNFHATAEVERPPAQRVILVPGQVEDDASVRVGCVDIRSNEALLAEVRRQNPDAFIIFKPHPDLLSGNRKVGLVGLERARALCDRVVVDQPLPSCLDICEEVHTMTSLVGFDALLRGLSVTVYGRPFYSGWGLTNDRHTIERRTRKLTLDMLVAGVLIRYPLYFSRRARALTTPEAIIAELREELRVNGKPVRQPRWRRRLRKLTHAIRGLLHGA